MSQRSIEMFLNQAFQKVLKELSRKQLRLKESVLSCLELIKKPGVLQVEFYEANPSKLNEFESILNKIVNTFKLICETKQPKIVITAIDCFQKMINYGCFKLSPIDLEDKDKKLIEKVIEIISSTYEISDDNIQLQIVKVMLTVVTSNQCEVHENALLSAIRCCFNVHLISKNNINLSTSKVTLTQMINTIFQKYQKLFDDYELQQSQIKRVEVHQNGVYSDESNGISDNNNTIAEDQILVEEIKKEDQEIERDNSDFNEPKPIEDTSPETIAKQVLFEIIGNSLSTLESNKELQQNDDSSNNLEDKQEEKKEDKQEEKKEEKNELKEQLDKAYEDCFYVFRAFCKLSTKEVPPYPADSIDMRRKLLSLELLQLIVDNSGSSLRLNEDFIEQAIKKYLFFSILTNGVSLFQRVFRLSLNIFQSLVTFYKDYLKNEIGIFFSKILLRVLSSSNSAIHQKNSVLRLLLHICKNAQTLVDIFLNYDCHLESEDLFESMVNYVSGIAKGCGSSTTTPQESETYLLALECLVTIMRSQVAWSSELADEAKPDDLTDDDSTIDNTNNSNGNGNHVNGSIRHTRSSSGNISATANGPSPIEESIDQFAKTKQRKQQLEYGKKLFNYKPKKGISFLIENGFMENTSKSVAKFLLNEDGLDKAQIGNYMGEIKDKFCFAVLYDYVDWQSFGNMPIDLAIRKFLGGFRLPGEAPVIDKIMEKFAEKYYNDNKESEDFIFLNADAAYVFSFHMIMLATDIHNPANKNKMTKREWVKNNKGLNDSRDFPEQFLCDIYDRIAAKSIKTKDDNISPPQNQDLLNPRQKRILFHKESRLVIKKSQEEILEKIKRKSSFFKSSNIEHVKPMFERCWCPMLAAFSVVLETCDGSNKQVTSLCLEGFRCAIRVSSIFFLETERNAFVTSLSQFTLLSNTREMKQKNIDAIKCLIQIANEDGNYLQDSWTQVLNCISQLSKIHLLGSGAKTITDFALSPAEERVQRRISVEHQSKLPNASSTGAINPSPLVNIINITKRQDKLIEGVNASSVVDQIDVSEIDKIFTNTTSLNSNAIVVFVKTLCNISEIEVNSPEPRTFSLQKLVEIAYFNMQRIRFVWSRIWVILATHFVKVACHKNLKVAMYAVDSVRQLAIKFLEKDELANYHFQKDFLKPFELIITNNSSLQIRELVVRCVSQIILSKSQNIKSGWKSMLSVFTFAASDSSEFIASLSFEMVEKIIKDHFPLIGDTFFVEFVNCLVAYAKSNHYKENSLRALEAIEFSAIQLAKGKIAMNILFPHFNSSLSLSTSLSPSNDNNDNNQHIVDENHVIDKNEEISKQSQQVIENENNNNNNEILLFNDCEIHLKYWFPILTGLSRVISHQHVDVRTSALDKLFSILTKYGDLFTPKLWELVFRGVLLPIFDNVNYASDSFLLHSDNEWLVTTCLKALSYFVELFSYYFQVLQFLLIDFLSLLTKCILQENENLAMIGCSCLLHFIIMNGSKWNQKTWFVVICTIRYIVNQNICVELLSIGEPKSKHSLRHQRTNSVDIQPPTPLTSSSSSDLSNNDDHQVQDETDNHNNVDNNHNISDGQQTSDHQNEDQVHHQSNDNNNNIDGHDNNNNGPKITNSFMYEGEEVNDLSIESKLKQSTPAKIRPYDVKVIIGKCTVQIELINAIKDVSFTHFDKFNIHHFTIIFDALLSVYNFASEVNNKKQIWRATSKTNIMSLIVQQESSSMMLYVHLLFKIYQSDDEEKCTLVENRLISIVEKVIKDYVNAEQNQQIPSNYLASKVPIVIELLRRILILPDQKLLKHLNSIYILIVELTTVVNPEIRKVVKEILIHIGKLHNFLPVDSKQ